MSANGYLQLVFYVVVLIALAKPLGAYMARIYEGQPAGLNQAGAPFELLIYRLCGVDASKEMGWVQYTIALLVFNLLGGLAVYGMQRLQAYLPFNPAAMGAVSPDSSFNTAISFMTNTNWQGYGGESTMSYLTQMAALAVQNFLSAATGMLVVIALIRGFARQSASTVGNFWVDLTRTLLYILLPLSFVFAVVLVSQGVVQTFSAYMVDLDSNPTKLIEIVEIGKQLLITRGSLTTFSIANDLAKYFAIIPAAFATTYPQLNGLNVMHLATPNSAILAAVIFNALIIPALIPLALRGVKYRAVGAATLLRENLLIYGIGGVILPFIGIKLIDMLLVLLGMA